MAANPYQWPGPPIGMQMPAQAQPHPHAHPHPQGLYTQPTVVHPQHPTYGSHTNVPDIRRRPIRRGFEMEPVTPTEDVSTPDRDRKLAPARRASQRPALSCTECARRKIKCDKKVPCEPCCKRGRSKSCFQEQWLPSGGDADLEGTGRATTQILQSDIAALQREVHELRDLRPRLAHLESLLKVVASAGPSPQISGQMNQATSPDGSGGQAGALSPSDSSVSDRLRTGGSANGGAEDAATTFEHLALGHVSSTHRGIAPMLSRTPIDAVSGTSSGPLYREQSISIIEFAMSIGWQHPVIHFTTFRDECQAYWIELSKDSTPVLNQAWLALFLALLSVGVHHMSIRQAAACGLSEYDAQVLPRKWFADCVAALDRSNYMANHTIQAVQTIAVLGYSAYDIAPANQLSVLHSCATRIAQCLGLHRLGPDPHGDMQPQVRMEREIGKRVWWALVTFDWTWISHSKTWSISPDQFSTPIPSNWRDDQFPQLNFSGGAMLDDGISMVMQQIIVGQIAAVMQHFFARLLGDPHSSHEDTIATAEAELQRIVAGLPPALQEAPPYESMANSNFPPYVPGLRHYLQITCSHKRLVMHRQFLQYTASRADAASVPPPLTPQVRESRNICVTASRHILRELARVTAQEVRPTWTTPYQAAGAATLLMLDVLERQATGSNDAETMARHQELEVGLKALDKLAGWSSIAQRGATLVRSLLRRELLVSSSVASSDSRKRGYDGQPDDGRMKRQVYDPSPGSDPSAGPSPSNYSSVQLSPPLWTFPVPQPFGSGHDLLNFTTADLNEPSGSGILGHDSQIETVLHSTFGTYGFESLFQ